MDDVAKPSPSGDDKLPNLTLERDLAKPSMQRSPRQTRASWALGIGALGVLIGMAGIGAALWLHEQGQSETRRLASEVAQLRLSLDLYARGNGAASAEDVEALAARLTTLEENGITVSLPPIGPASIPQSATADAGNEDCLPLGMRILVTEGDNYSVCGQPLSIDVAQVANGYLVLGDGTTIASGGSILVPGSTTCSIGVTSGGDEGITGYAEIRVTCA
ncbi:hypothetical protein [Devosia chinhatensis]|uniref:Uncharacterized protein n=1 Tax=Devosia chinhatensis TaxID=429727 RepID=A0A0F5FHD5_9HYPH|nr:hypothetical protein [Devosia chinhatensis]KKB07597.1 hypothetical protein VE26_12870 [Devosia chinhatensis]